MTLPTEAYCGLGGGDSSLDGWQGLHPHRAGTRLPLTGGERTMPNSNPSNNPLLLAKGSYPIK